MLLPLVTLAVSGLLVPFAHGRIVPRSAEELLKCDATPEDDPTRTKPLLLDIPGLPKLPKVSDTGRVATAAASGLPLADIQGDILVGMHKPIELFFFFSIKDAAAFKAKFKKSVLPLITSTTQILASDPTKQPSALVNVAFSSSGLASLNVTDSLNDGFFIGGQFSDAGALGDPGTNNWVSAFKGTSMHGVLLIASDTTDRIQTALKTIMDALGTAVTEAHRIQGAARPGPQSGHEHFGFLDGVSQPVITGFNDGRATLGDGVLQPIPAGIILTGLDGDQTTRPSWAVGGSFLAFRQLKQLVPEFNKFLLDHPTNGSPELTGARMIGRWKSGAPIDLSPTVDNPSLGADATRNNLFNYTHPEIAGFDIDSDQTRCPFSAHIRKTRPRGDQPFNQNQIIRAGIPFGPEVTADEKQSNTTKTERGLAFVSYQSNLGNGFRFQQTIWANNQNFPFGKSDTTPGFDPVIGQNGGQPRFVSGTDLKNATKDLTLTIDFVQSRGGEYFFSPPISALSSKILA